MKRSGNLRRSELKADPEKVRLWQRRSRARARERAHEAPTRHRRRRKVCVPKDVRARVFARTKGICVRPGCEQRAVHIHHWFDEQFFPELALDEENMSGACPYCNWNHHNASPRFPFEAVPACTLALARRADRGRREAHLARYYPKRSARQTKREVA